MILNQTPIADLIPYATNSRTHDESQVAQIAASIREFGFTNPILVDEQNSIIAGHGRLQAARKLSIDTVPTITLDGLTDAQKKAYVIADNQLALNAGWDMDMLKLEIEGLKDIDFDIDLLGFDDSFIDDMLAETTEGLTDEDAVPEPPETPVSVEGDIWILGDHRLMCGDSTCVEAVDKLMDGQKADMVFTDPPYGINYDRHIPVKRFSKIKNDNVLLNIAPIIDTYSDGWCFVWTSWKVLPEWVENMAALGRPNSQVIWHKSGGAMGHLTQTFASDYETAMVWNRGAELTGKRIGSVWSIGKDGATTYAHPTQKPVALAKEAIDKTTHRSDKILDLFGGSGSTLIACEKTNRTCYMMELDPTYCDVILQRYIDFVGDSGKVCLSTHGTDTMPYEEVCKMRRVKAA